MDYHDGLDLMLAVSVEVCRDFARVDPVTPIPLHVIDLKAEICGDAFPQGGELSGFEH